MYVIYEGSTGTPIEVDTARTEDEAQSLVDYYSTGVSNDYFYDEYTPTDPVDAGVVALWDNFAGIGSTYPEDVRTVFGSIDVGALARVLFEADTKTTSVPGVSQVYVEGNPWTRMAQAAKDYLTGGQA